MNRYCEPRFAGTTQIGLILIHLFVRSCMDPQVTGFTPGLLGYWNIDGLPHSTELDVRRTRDGAATRAQSPSPGLDRIAATEIWRARVWQLRAQITVGD